MLVLGTGCPVGGEEGVLHEAMLRDEIKRMAKESCREADVRANCGANFISCMEACQEEMKKRARK
jgi:hypothetical protein